MRRSLLDPLSVRGRQSPARARQVRGVITDHIPCGVVIVDHYKGFEPFHAGSARADQTSWMSDRG